MIKNFSKLLLCTALALASCSSVDDEPAMAPEEGQEMATVKMSISRAEAQDFADAGIDEITVYVYNVERKTTSLYSQTTMHVGEGEFEMSFPLGNTYQTFAVANAASVTGTETLEDFTVNLDPVAKNDVWTTPVVKFASDKSVSDIQLVFSRRVASVEFVPAESAEELAAITDFDNINLTFTEVATSFKVSGTKAVSTSLTFAASAANGYKASFYTFGTASLPAGTLNIEYTKGGNVVQKSQPLECGNYAAGTKVTSKVRITDPSILEGSRSASNAVDFEVSEF